MNAAEGLLGAEMDMGYLVGGGRGILVFCKGRENRRVAYKFLGKTDFVKGSGMGDMRSYKR